jgi:hypothetical protein
MRAERRLNANFSIDPKGIHHLSRESGEKSQGFAKYVRINEFTDYVKEISFKTLRFNKYYVLISITLHGSYDNGHR